MAGSVKCAKVEFGTGGTYPSPATVHATVDGSGNLVLTDVANSSGLTLTELAAGIGVHAIDGEYHTGVDGDFATQYYNITRLKAFLNDSGNSDEIGIASDVGGNVLLSTHVADATIHGSSAKFILEVAKDGKPYTTIQSAIDAVPTTGPDAASATQRYDILIYPGVYTEDVALNKDYTSLRGSGSQDNTTITSSTVGKPALTITGNACSIHSLTAKHTAGVAVKLSAAATLRDCTLWGAGAGAGIAVTTDTYSEAIISHCFLIGILYALYVSDEGGATVEFSTLSATGAGAYIGVVAAGNFTYCYLYGGTKALSIKDTTATLRHCVYPTGESQYVVSGAAGNTTSAVVIEPTFMSAPIDPAGAGTVTVTANTHTDSATITWPSQNDGLSVGYGANGVDATGALSGYDSYFVRRANGATGHASSGAIVCIEDVCTGYDTNTAHNLYLIRGGEMTENTGEFIRAYNADTSAVVFQLTTAGNIINAGSLTVGGDAIINADASGTADSCTMTLRTTDSDGIVVDYKLYASHDLGVGCFVGGTTVYAPFAASAFYGSGAGLTDVPVTALPPGGRWPALTSNLIIGRLQINYAADGSDYKSVEIAAPTSGTNRYTLDLAAPSGGTINGSLRSQGYLYLGTGSKCMYESTSYWYFNNCNSYRFYGSTRGIHVDVWSGGCKLLAYNYSGDSDGFTIQSQSETLTLATLANNKNILLKPHGTGVVSVSAAQISGSHADGLTIAVTTASKPLTLTPGSGAKVETAAQVKAAGFEAGAAAGVASGSFVDADGNTLTITGGIITAITPP
jgi:hypothetical protein